MTDPFDAVASPHDETPRDRWGRYLIPDITGKTAGKPVAYTRATTFASTIADGYALNLWKQRMAVKGLASRQDLYALAASTPLEDRDGLNRIVEKAAEAAGTTVAASLGTALHKFTEQHDRGEQVDVPGRWAPEMAEYARLVDEAGLVMEHIERIVVIPEYGVAGTFDRIARLAKDLTIDGLAGRAPFTLPAGSRVIVDLKTGQNLSYSWSEIAVQLALYAHGAGMWIKGTDKFDKMPDVDRRAALVIHLPVRGSVRDEATATLHAVDIAAGWNTAGLCAEVRAWRRNKRLTGSVTAMSPACGERAGDWGPCVKRHGHTICQDAAGRRWASPVPDGQKCIICRVPANGGRVAHKKTCSDAIAGDGPPATQARRSPTASAELVPATGPDWTAQIGQARDAKALSAIWREARAAGEWTAQLEEWGKARLAELRAGK